MTIDTYGLLSTMSGRMLPNLKGILKKAQADAAARKIDPQVLLTARLAPDMLDFTHQIQIVTDQIKGGYARLSGSEVPKWDDTEKSFAELEARIDKAIAYAQTFKPEQFEGAEIREIELKFPQGTLQFSGRDYLLGFVVPNFYFHVTTAYGILRHNGVPLGKRDFAG
jgi:uncharacterized protein